MFGNKITKVWFKKLNVWQQNNNSLVQKIECLATKQQQFGTKESTYGNKTITVWYKSTNIWQKNTNSFQKNLNHPKNKPIKKPLPNQERGSKLFNQTVNSISINCRSFKQFIQVNILISLMHNVLITWEQSPKSNTILQDPTISPSTNGIWL